MHRLTSTWPSLKLWTTPGGAFKRSLEVLEPHPRRGPPPKKFERATRVLARSANRLSSGQALVSLFFFGEHVSWRDAHAFHGAARSTVPRRLCY